MIIKWEMTIMNSQSFNLDDQYIIDIDDNDIDNHE